MLPGLSAEQCGAGHELIQSCRAWEELLGLEKEGTGVWLLGATLTILFGAEVFPSWIKPPMALGSNYLHKTIFIMWGSLYLQRESLEGHTLGRRPTLEDLLYTLMRLFVYCLLFLETISLLQ